MGRWTRATNLPPMSAQMKRIVMPNRLPPGRHSSSVIDHTTPKSTAAKRTGRDRRQTLHYSVMSYDNNNVIMRHRHLQAYLRRNPLEFN